MTNLFPISTRAVLYEHNVIDNRLIYNIKKEGDLTYITENSFVVTKERLLHVIYSNFLDDLEIKKGCDLNTVQKYTDSVFLVSRMLETFENLRLVRFDISDHLNYSRFDQNEEAITFDFNITSALINFPEVLDDEGVMRRLRDMFFEMGILEDDDHFPTTYIKMYASDLMNLVTAHSENVEGFQERFQDIIESFDVLIDPKLCDDNALLFLIIRE